MQLQTDPRTQHIQCKDADSLRVEVYYRYSALLSKDVHLYTQPTETNPVT